MPGIKDVARLAGVSAATVSRALCDDARVSVSTRERVRAAAKELGYVKSFSAAGLASGRNRNIGVLLPTVSRWYFSAVLEGIAEALVAKGYDLTLYNSGRGRHQETLLDDFLLRQRVDGVIIVNSCLRREDIGKILALRKPVVSVGGSPPGVAAVRSDELEASAAATSHLISLGHRRIAHVGGTGGPPRSRSSGRFRGFQAAMEQAGIPLRRQWIVPAESTLGGGYEAARMLLTAPKMDRPSAVVGSSDDVAAGVILAARELALSVPDDLSVVGVDGSEVGEAFGLTTANLFAQRQGQRAVRQLLDELARHGDRSGLFYPESRPELVIRSSTGIPTDPSRLNASGDAPAAADPFAP